MNFLTTEQVLFIHAILIKETGGQFGIRDLGLLESALARPYATFDGKDLYTDLFSKAAALLQSLILNHPFVDGNKRVGISAAGLFVEQNNYQLLASVIEIERFTLQVAKGNMAFPNIVTWFKENSSQL
ncbi:MAG: type II toxin-antitoxin system death-on-curing family toxin [Anaerolineae bacterium]|nr:type II toxin-antitoxin system death-on-curing family toxin [Anaerolineae bacterium]